MNDVLNDHELFVSRFLSESTKNRLKAVQDEDLRLVVKKLHSIWNFYAYATPRLWTPKCDDEPLIVIGNAAKNAALKKPRFGICMITNNEPRAAGGSLHIWTDIETLNEYITSSNNADSFRNDWVAWRLKSTDSTFIRTKYQLIDECGKVNDQLERQDSQIYKFISSIASRLRAPKELTGLMRPILDALGLKGNVITPFTLDIFKHSEDEDFDQDSNELSSEKKSIDKPKAITPVLNSDSQDGLTISHFHCSEVLTVERSVARHTEIDFLNLKFKANMNLKDELIGPGIYGLFYNEYLIYAGLFINGNKGSPFGGNIADMRWKKHIATVTMRGKDVTVAKSTARYLDQMKVNDSIANICIPDIEEVITKERGCVAGLRRVLFALQNWPRFEAMTPTNILEPFSFSYIRLNSSSQNYNTARKKVKRSEKDVIRQLEPFCNKETPLYKGRKNVSPKEFLSCVIGTLN
jgi:hypothetical protein